MLRLSPPPQRALRDAVLTEENRLQFERMAGLIGVVMAADRDGVAKIDARGSSDSARTALRESAGSGTATPLGTMSTLLGSPDGATLRRIARDVDSTDLLLRMVRPDARPLRELGTRSLAAAVQQKLRLRPWLRRVSRRMSGRTDRAAANLAADGAPSPGGTGVSLQDHPAAVGVVSREGARLAADWPASPTSLALQRRRTRRADQVLGWLANLHLQSQFASGVRGYVAMAALVWLALRVGVTAVALAVLRSSLGSAACVAGGGLSLVQLARRAGLLATARLHRMALWGVYAMAMLVLLWRSKCNDESCVLSGEESQ